MLRRLPSEEFDPSASPESPTQRNQALERAYKAFGVNNPNEALENQALAANHTAAANEVSTADETPLLNSPPQANVPQADVPQADVPQADVPQANAPQADASQANVSRDNPPAAIQNQQQQEQGQKRKTHGDSCMDFFRCMLCWYRRDAPGGDEPSRAGSQGSRQRDVSTPANDPRRDDGGDSSPNVPTPSKAIPSPKLKGRAGPPKKVATASVAPVSPTERTFGLRGARGQRVPGDEEEEEEEYHREEGIFPIEDVHGPPPSHGPAASAPAQVAGNAAAGDAAKNQQASQAANQLRVGPRLRRMPRLPAWVVHRRRADRNRTQGLGGR